MGASHYIATSFAPTLLALMQIKQLGQIDPFKTETRLTRFAKFYLNLLTPPEVRFEGSPRCFIAVGDSSTETSPLFGQLGTAFRDADPGLSKRLMGAWHASGRPHSSFFGSTVLSIDDRLPASELSMESASFPGYYSVLRTGFGTPDETAVWIINGDFYRDHRHADAGSIVYYALGVPISVNWGAIYYPRTPSAFFHSSVLPATSIGQAWDAPNPTPDLTARDTPSSGWSKASEIVFSRNKEVDRSVSRFVSKNVEWTRTVGLYHADPAVPLLVIEDSFNEGAQPEDKVLTINLMAKGAVAAPWGLALPELRTHPMAQKAKSPSELPSAAEPRRLPAGVSKFSFTGQFGVDFDIFVLGQTPQEAMLGNWAVSWTQLSQTKWEERQHILRIRGKGPFKLLLIPYRAGHRTLNLAVTNSGSKFIVFLNGRAQEL
jgi:hypothetical protein